MAGFNGRFRQAMLALRGVGGLPLRAVRQWLDAWEHHYIDALPVRRGLRPLGLEWLLYYRRHQRLLRSVRQHRADGGAAALVARLRGKTLVFSVTAGRSGTTLATRLVALLPDVTAEHEPAPALHTYLRQIDRNPAQARQFLLRYKLPYIAGVATSKYVELSHVFCKGFIEPLLDLGLTPNLLMLRRDPRQVALSYLERFTVPERTFLGLEWLISPKFPGRLALPGWRRMTDYQLLFWYALEIERRQRDYAGLVQARGGKVFAMAVADLADFGCFVAMAQNLGLLGPGGDPGELAARHAAICGVRWSRTEGARWPFTGDIDSQEEEVWQAISASDPDLRHWITYVHAGAPYRPNLSHAQPRRPASADLHRRRTDRDATETPPL